MNGNLIAEASVAINAAKSAVWHALVDPEEIKKYFFGTMVTADWRKGGRIVWKGEWQGKSYEDKGVVLEFEPERTVKYTHFSPLSGLPDKPENYHSVTITLSDEGKHTRVSLAQDNNPSERERDNSAKNWDMVLAALKKFLEK